MTKQKWYRDVEYPVIDGEKPDLPGDVFIELKGFSGKDLVRDLIWPAARIFKIVDERYPLKPKEETRRYWKQGERLEVGMWYLNADKVQVRAAYVSEVEVGYLANLGFLLLDLLCNIKPIDTRTEKEKAVDSIYRSDLSVRDNLANAYDKWVNNDN